jgi:lathosterol oxidase
MGSAMIFVLGFSGCVFYNLYWPSKVTYERWRWKTNPKFPTVSKVRDEIVQTLKGMGAAAICPALALWLYAQGDDAPIKQYGYCGTTPEYGAGYNLFCFGLVWIGSDFYEMFYHRIGHTFPSMWNWHRHHHVFFNPSPFSVVADEFVDQFMRALPLVCFPIFMPMNIDVLWFTFSILFYGVGVYHHCGYELRWPNAHTGFFNTSYHHYLHHSISVNRTPYHCGFMFKCWDQLFDNCYKGKCFCVMCSQEAGLRTREQFDAIEIPDYRQLLRPSFWFSTDFIALITGTSAEDINEELKEELRRKVVAAEQEGRRSVSDEHPAIAVGGG